MFDFIIFKTGQQMDKEKGGKEKSSIRLSKLTGLIWRNGKGENCAALILVNELATRKQPVTVATTKELKPQHQSVICSEWCSQNFLSPPPIYQEILHF